MDQTLTEFIRALRGSHIRVSTSESLDAFKAIELIGYDNRFLLKNSLGACLAKTELEKFYFDSCFERFFTVQRIKETLEKPEDDSNNSLTESVSDEHSSSDNDSDKDIKAEQSQAESNNGSMGNAEPNSMPDTANSSPAQSKLGKMLTKGSSSDFALSLNQAATQTDITSIRSFTQRGLYGRRIMLEMGLADLEDEIRRKSESDVIEDRESARELIQARNILRAEVRDFVERQLVLFTASQGEQFREEVIKNMSLNSMDMKAFSRLNDIVRKMAKRLVAIHSRRRRVYKKGQLNIKKTLQSNMAFDGALFNLKWKSIKVDRPRVMVICDVSGSVAEVSRFLLMFLYSLNDVIPNIRSFAFSSSLGEVTKHFEHLELAEATQTILADWGRGSTDYGESLIDFKNLAYKDIDHRTTIIILGDARNNYREHRSEIFKEISERAKQVIWLNPERKIKWSSGDSVMKHYQPYCQMAETCNTLNHLEKFVDKLLKRSN